MDGQIGQAIVTPDDYHHRQEAAWNAFLEKKEKSWVVSCWTPRRRNDDIHGPPTRDVWKAVGHPPPPNVICAATHRWKREKLKNSGGPLDFFIGILFSSLIIKTTTQIQKFKRGNRTEGGRRFWFHFLFSFVGVHFISPCCVQSRWLDPTFDPPSLFESGRAGHRWHTKSERIPRARVRLFGYDILLVVGIRFRWNPPSLCPLPDMLKSNTRRYEPQI